MAKTTTLWSVAGIVLVAAAVVTPMRDELAAMAQPDPEETYLACLGWTGMWSLDIDAFVTPRVQHKLGMVLHVVATQFFILFIAILFLTWMEVWKGVELLQKVRNVWFSFGGARELIGYAVICLIVGRVIDVYARRLNPYLRNNPERGWHYRH